MIFRRLLIVALALLIAVQVIRIAAVEALAQAAPAEAARVWSGHPEVDVQLGMIAIAEAARERRPIDDAMLSRIYGASTAAPLAPEPFLVRGVQAQMAGDTTAAEQAFLAARRRNARSLPARYFLADLYLRNADAARGLPEIAVLARLVPGGPAKLAPYVATYAQNRANWPSLRAMFRAEPRLEEAGLRALAADARNADAVMALADRRAASSWLPILVESLSKAGDYRKAREVWSAVSGARLGPGALIFDPQFTQEDAPPPFNWALTSSTVGLAERQQGRGLHVIYYGQEDGALVSQLLVLRPGSYRLSTTAPSAPAGAASLRWAVVCAGDGKPIASVPLDQAIGREWRFAIPASCAAQRLELIGTGSDVARQTDLTIRSVSLAAEQPGG